MFIQILNFSLFTNTLIFLNKSYINRIFVTLKKIKILLDVPVGEPFLI